MEFHLLGKLVETVFTTKGCCSDQDFLELHKLLYFFCLLKKKRKKKKSIQWGRVITFC